MIEPERVLRYIETVFLLMDDGEELANADRRKEFMDHIYSMAHVGTTHKCQHPKWEEEFLKAEADLVNKKHMKSWPKYLEKKNEGMPGHTGNAIAVG